MLLAEDQLTELSGRVPFTWEAAGRDFTTFAPMSFSLAAVAAGFDLTCQGSFPDAASALQVMIAQPTMGGTELRSASVTKTSASEIVGHFAAPTGMAVGSAQVIVLVSPPETFYPGSGFMNWTA